MPPSGKMNESQWWPARSKFLVPVRALSKIFRAQLRNALNMKPELFRDVLPETCKRIGSWIAGRVVSARGDEISRALPLELTLRILQDAAISNGRLVKQEACPGTNGNVSLPLSQGQNQAIQDEDRHGGRVHPMR